MTSSALRRKFGNNLNTKQDLLVSFPGQLGDGQGNVIVPGLPGYVYVRILSGVSEVFNNRVPPDNNLLVSVGRDPLEPDLSQVLGTRTKSPGGEGIIVGSGYTPAIRYQWHAIGGGQDPLWVEKRQYLPGRIGAWVGMLIQVYPDIYWSGAVMVQVQHQTADLTSYLPTTAGQAAAVLVTVNAIGTIITTKGAEVNFADLALSNIPAIPAGTSAILGAVRVYQGQTEILEMRTNSDIIDLRGSGWSNGGSGTGSEGGGGGGGGEYLRRDAFNDPVTGPLDINANDVHALRVQSAVYTLGDEISTGSIPVTDASGAAITGLTIGNWYAVEAFGGPWSPWTGITPHFYDFWVSNDEGATWSGNMGGVDAIIPDPNGMYRYPIPTMHVDMPAWGSFVEIVDEHYVRFYFKATTTSIRVGIPDYIIADNEGTLSWRLWAATAVFDEKFNVDSLTDVTTIKQLATPSTTQVDNLNSEFLNGLHADEIGWATNPMTDAGDMIIGASGGTPDRLPIGSDGKILKIISGSPTWFDENIPGSPSENVALVSMGASATASSEYASTMGPTNAIDDTLLTNPGWQSDSGIVGQWIKIDLSAAKIIIGYWIDQDPYSVDYATEFDIEYSTDGTTWLLAAHIIFDYDYWSSLDASTELIPFGSSYNARYWRFTATAEPASPHTWRIQKLGLSIVNSSSDLVFDKGSTAHNHLAVWDGQDSHLIKDGGEVPSAGVTRSGSTTDDHLALWDGTDADSLKDGGIPGAGGGDVATDTIWEAKGDLAIGTGVETASRLTVGANTHVLTADSAEATGVKWAPPSGGGSIPAALNILMATSFR